MVFPPVRVKLASPGAHLFTWSGMESSYALFQNMQHPASIDANISADSPMMARACPVICVELQKRMLVLVTIFAAV